MLEIYSPNDGSLIGQVPLEHWPQAEAKLEAARARFADRPGWLTPHRRIAILEQLALLMEHEKDALAMQIAQEGGKPLTDARIEVTRAIDGVHIAVREIPHLLHGEEIPMGLTPATTGRQAVTVREPSLAVLKFEEVSHSTR
jgi:acyl-CoA reductase-like NAD-dependent aldehyde dehydrogenase